MLINTKEYISILENIKLEIATAQQRTLFGANKELIILYWNIGKKINNNKTWGSKFIENLANDIRIAFPKIRGFSFRNLKYMAQFANIYNNLEIGQEAPAQLTWTHNIVLMNRLKDRQQMLWYANKTIENGWSSNVLDMQIDRNLHERQALADKNTNFKDRLPALQSDMAQEIMKDPYIFDFIENREGMVEREIEDELVEHITQFLLELGSGFAYVGRQYHMEIGNQDFYIDLLFYHLKLRSYIVIELKNTEFKPEYAGKLNFYVSAVDGELRQPSDNQTIGILLCKEKNKIIAEYSLKDIDKPISVNEFKLLDKLPKKYVEILPTSEDFESRLKLPEISNKNDKIDKIKKPTGKK